MQADPVGAAPRLYVESLNAMFAQQTNHVAALETRVPGHVLALEIAAAAVVTALLYVTFDLDRPTRGLINIEPTALIAQRAAMALPPAATGPG